MSQLVSVPGVAITQIMIIKMTCEYYSWFCAHDPILQMLYKAMNILVLTNTNPRYILTRTEHNGVADVTLEPIDPPEVQDIQHHIMKRYKAIHKLAERKYEEDPILAEYTMQNIRTQKHRGGSCVYRETDKA